MKMAQGLLLQAGAPMTGYRFWELKPVGPPSCSGTRGKYWFWRQFYQQCSRQGAGCTASSLASHPWAQSPQQLPSSEGWDRSEPCPRCSSPSVHRGTESFPRASRASKPTRIKTRNRTPRPVQQGCQTTWYNSTVRTSWPLPPLQARSLLKTS